MGRGFLATIMENLELNIAKPLEGEQCRRADHPEGNCAWPHIVSAYAPSAMQGGPGAFSGVRVEMEARNAESDKQLAGPLKDCRENSTIPEGIVKGNKITITDEYTEHAVKLEVFCVGRGISGVKARTNQIWMSHCAN